jgi:hypothetical protein
MFNESTNPNFLASSPCQVSPVAISPTFKLFQMFEECSFNSRPYSLLAIWHEMLICHKIICKLLLIFNLL